MSGGGVEAGAERPVIRIQGARQHNLRNLSVALPRDALTVLTGVSGSGKSSLAFDTLYAEGYRKYLDSLSTKVRAVLDQVARPEVDFIEGLSPVIAIEQRESDRSSPRATLASLSEVADYARLLWAYAGERLCPLDGGRIERRSLDDCLAQLLAEPEGTRMLLLAPYLKAKSSVLRGEIPHLRQRGFQRIRLDGAILSLDRDDLIPAGPSELQLDLVIDRLVLRADQRSRLADSLELAFREGSDRALALIEDSEQPDGWREVRLSQHLACTVCGTVYAPLTPRSFSPDHADGACPTCGGLGQTRQFVPDLVVPDASKSVRGGAIKPWRLGSKAMIIRRNAILKQLAEQLPFDPKAPWAELPENVRETILHGAGEQTFAFKLRPGKAPPQEQPFEGVLADLETTLRETSSDGLKARLMTYQISQRCPDCGGKRLNAAARAVQLQGLAYTDFLALSLKDAAAWARGLDLPAFADAVRGLQQRLGFLVEVGLDYLTLDRPFRSLSGGEAQRVRLATQLGMRLVGVTYVLDEPTIGLHASDVQRLLKTLLALRARGNAVIVVEHDPDILRAAEHLVEVGPGAGEAGGRLVFQGSVAEAEASTSSRTGAYLSGRAALEHPGERRAPSDARGWLRLLGATEHNLKGVDLHVPLGLLTCVTGVSGSGKSTLVHDVLGAALARRLNKAKVVPGRHTGLEGVEALERLVVVDQAPIGRSPRSNPATFTKLFDELRALYAQTPLAKVRGYTASRFSFNTSGGRCERCKGDGVVKLDMHFLDDVYVECPSCKGARYNRATLEVRYRGCSIAEALALTVDEALERFRAIPKIAARLETLQAVGLGYLRLGQPAQTLSGGEAQRLKLSLELSRRSTRPTLYILDEPTSGLHWDDIQQLLNLLVSLRDAGHTLLIIEHHLDLIRLADWVVDLGPGGGAAGGEQLYAGPIEGLLEVERSPTARALRAVAGAAVNAH